MHKQILSFWKIEPRISNHWRIVLKNYTTDAINTASKRAIQKQVEITSDLIGNKISDKMMSVSKNF